MKKTFISFTLFLLSVAQQSAADDQVLRTAVYTIKSEVLPEGFTETLTNHLESELLTYSGYRVISRSNLDVLITEDHLSQSGITGDEFRVVENGGRSSVDKICTGSIRRLGRSYSFTLKLIDVTSARIDASAQTIYNGPIEGLLDIGSKLLSRVIPTDIETADGAQHMIPDTLSSDTTSLNVQPLPAASTINRKEDSQQSGINRRQESVASENHADNNTEVNAEPSEPKKLSELGRNISIGSVMIFATLAALVVFTRNQ